MCCKTGGVSVTLVSEPVSRAADAAEMAAPKPPPPPPHASENGAAPRQQRAWYGRWPQDQHTCATAYANNLQHLQRVLHALPVLQHEMMHMLAALFRAQINVFLAFCRRHAV